MKALSFLQNGGWNARIGFGLGLVFVGLACAVMVGTPYDPVAIDIRMRLQPPGATHWLGTDQFGRDVMSRLMVGAKVSLMTGLFTAFGALSLGTLIGATSAFLGGWTDKITSAFMDTIMAFPGLLLALALISVLGAGQTGVVLALAIAYTPVVVRVVRSSVLSIREKDYIEASQALGNGRLMTLFRHVLPNCIGPLTVIGSSLFATALLSESALSFLGLGVPPPSPTWGGMLADSRQFAATAVWLVLAPGIAISLALLAINLLGDALRDHFDPRMSA